MRTLFILLLSCLPCFAQFGVEQPMFQSVGLLSVPTPPQTGLSYWWVASDLPQGTVSTGWVDRIQGMRLTNGIAANQPTVTSNYIEFTSSLEYLSNVLTSGVINYWAVGAIMSSPGPYSSQRCWFDRQADGVASLPAGWYFRSSASFYDLTFLVGDVSGITNGVMFDVITSRTNAGIEYLWTNAVFCGSYDHGVGTLDLGPNMGIGSASDQASRPWIGKLYELLIWTNLPAVGHSYILTNFHNYGTTKYGTYYIP